MQWAEGGSLEEFISTRMGRALNSGRPGPYPLDLDDPDSQPSSGSEDIRSRSARIKAFRKRQQLSSQERKEHDRRKHKRATAVHLFSALEVKDIFSDVVNGLGFLHAKSVLHLDLKPLNVLLTWDEGCLMWVFPFHFLLPSHTHITFIRLTDPVRCSLISEQPKTCSPPTFAPEIRVP
jgi:serine/threonine protein kinase